MRRTAIPAAILSAAVLLGAAACDGTDSSAPAGGSSTAASPGPTASSSTTSAAPATGPGSSDPKAAAAASSVLAKAPSAAADIGTLQFRPSLAGSVTTILHVTGLHRSGNAVQLTFWAQGANPEDGTVMLAGDPTTMPYLVDPSSRTKYSVDTFTGADGKPWAIVSEAQSTSAGHPSQMEARYTVPASATSFQVGIDGAAGGRTVTTPVA